MVAEGDSGREIEIQYQKDCAFDRGVGVVDRRDDFPPVLRLLVCGAPD